MRTGGLYAAVRDGAGGRPDTAMLAEGRTWTYGELLDAAAEFAALLERRPVPGAPVVAELTDPVATALVMLGGDLSGVSVVHRDPSSPDRIPGWVVHDGRTGAPGADDVPCIGGRLWLRADGRAEPSVDLPDGAQIFLTSGSTGVPTAVVRTASAMLADAHRVAARLAYGPNAPVVSAAPLFHVYGVNYGLIGPLLSGAPVRWCPSRSIPSQLGRAVQELGARTLIALPTHYGLLAGTPSLADPVWDTMLATLRSAVSAGARLAPRVARAVAERFGFDFFNCYGSSEAGAVTLALLTGQESDDWIGSPLPSVTARVERLDPTSEVGELLLQTTSLATERIGPGGREPLARPDGWYLTGDLAVTDAAGDIRLVGRASSVINVAGKKVSPSEVERVLAAHPQVADVQVIADVDVARGQVPVARVVLRDTAAATQLVGWCRDRLAPHQMPRRFDVVAEIARSATGKPLARVEPEQLVETGDAP
jgi:acyl-coenzyme A synthetase/AMP-(fatty) acid ligase